ncbi:MAG: STAS domain-containing protein [Phycisphaerales bacterium]|nr:STAS domain-containing protein [Phycisphaerales bacterium]
MVLAATIGTLKPMERESTAKSIFVTPRVEGRGLWLRLRGPSINEREAQIITSEATISIEQADDVCVFLVLDMQEVSFISSMGIGMLLDLRNRAGQQNMKIVLANVTDQLNTLLSIVKLEKVLSICTSDRDLKRALR